MVSGQENEQPDLRNLAGIFTVHGDHVGDDILHGHRQGLVRPHVQHAIQPIDHLIDCLMIGVPQLVVRSECEGQLGKLLAELRDPPARLDQVLRDKLEVEMAAARCNELRRQ